MIERWNEYEHHNLVGRTYDTISEYDDWMVSRFLCDYITHYRDGQRWGLSKLSNSPENNHSKVIETKIELKEKIGYLNKDRYFMTNNGDFLGHLVPQYSDYHLWSTKYGNWISQTRRNSYFIWERWTIFVWMAGRTKTIDTIHYVWIDQEDHPKWYTSIKTLIKKVQPLSDQFTGHRILTMNKEIKSTNKVKSLLDKMSNIPSFKFRFSSAQEYIEYTLERDLEILKKNPNKTIF